MKKEKIVVTECPRCHTIYEKEPLIELQKDGSTKFKEIFIRECKFCRVNTQRRRLGKV